MIMQPSELTKNQTVIRRIFIAQIVMIGSSTLMVLTAIRLDFGFFWFSFLAGLFGGSLAFLKRVQSGKVLLVEEAASSWYTALMPILYGGLMASVSYFLFVSGILSGQGGTGLIATNLFPDFSLPSTPKTEATVAILTKQVAVKDWLLLRPTELVDAGKLMVWSFLAGYSENFVTGILGRLETTREPGSASSVPRT